MQNFHCCDNAALDNSSKFAKLRLMIDVLNDKFIDFANVEEFHSIDEYMVPCFGRHGSKQFIRGTPIRWGYKLWTATTRLEYIK